MANLSIKDVPEPWAEALRQQATRHHRSLQGELMSIIERAVQEASLATVVGSHGDRQFNFNRNDFGHNDRGLPILRRGVKTIEQIAEEQHKAFPQPVKGGPLAVDIIRQDRDSR